MYLPEIKDKRTVEQMVQAARSGKQNIVEASLEKSLKMNIKLTGVARGSFGELLEDYKDFLRVRKLIQWDKGDQRLEPIRRMRIGGDGSSGTNWSNGSNGTIGFNLSNWTNSPEYFSNLMITLISKENYLLDQMVKALENKFVKEGGYSENLTKKRLTEKKLKIYRNFQRGWD